MLRQIEANSNYLQQLEEKERLALYLDGELQRSRRTGETIYNDSETVRQSFIDLSRKSELLEKELEGVQRESDDLRRMLAQTERQGLTIHQNTSLKLHEQSTQRTNEDTVRQTKLDELRERADRIEQTEIPEIEEQIEAAAAAKKRLWLDIELVRGKQQARLADIEAQVKEIELASATKLGQLNTALARLDDFQAQSTATLDSMSERRNAVLDRLQAVEISASAVANAETLSSLGHRVDALTVDLRAVKGNLMGDNQQVDTVLQGMTTRAVDLKTQHSDAETQLAEAEAGLAEQKQRARVLTDQLEGIQRQIADAREAGNRAAEEAQAQTDSTIAPVLSSFQFRLFCNLFIDRRLCVIMH